ncbi:hypothetical protein BH10BAC3_BH10BAC3_12530 [soil metagenome]
MPEALAAELAMSRNNFISLQAFFMSNESACNVQSNDAFTGDRLLYAVLIFTSASASFNCVSNTILLLKNLIHR